jgi:hypothetical protein
VSRDGFSLTLDRELQQGGSAVFTNEPFEARAGSFCPPGGAAVGRGPVFALRRSSSQASADPCCAQLARLSSRFLLGFFRHRACYRKGDDGDRGQAAVAAVAIDADAVVWSICARLQSGEVAYATVHAITALDGSQGDSGQHGPTWRATVR